jgi:protein TonB
MDAASLPMKTMDKPGERLLKALVLSLALHLALIMLIKPAPQGVAREVVLQARITTTSMQPEARPSMATEAAAEPPERAATEVPMPTDTAPTPVQPQPQQTEVGSGSEGPEPNVQSGETKMGEPEAVVSGPSTGLPEIPVMLDTRWYTARQVDRRPEIMTPALPVYPEEARRRGIQGSVVIEVHIDEFGRVREIAVLEANPPGVFDAAVLDVYGRAQYRPAVLDGRPVRYIGKYRVLFELD